MLNISSVSQEYRNLFNFKEEKESNKVAGITKNAGEQFFCQSTDTKIFQLQGSKKQNNVAGAIKNAGEHFLCQSTILQSL